MNVFLVTAGSRGDVQPFVALGQGLKKVGHSVTLCTCSSFESFIREHDLTYGYMNDDFIKLVTSEAGQEMMENSGDFFSLVKTMLTLIKDAKALNREMLKDAWSAARAAQADIVVFHPKILAGPHIAEKLAIPAIMAILVPAIVPTDELVAMGFPDLKLGSWYNKLSYVVLHKGYHMYDDVVNEFRQTVLGLGQRPKSVSPLQMTNGQPISVLHGYSEQVSPRPSDWPQQAHVTGYWFLTEKDDYRPPAELIDFLEAGEAPVYVGFGSMAGRRPERMATIVVEALQKAGVRGILATGWGGLKANHLPQSIFKVDNVPHDWLFPRVSAVVHHGGAGTTAAGLRAGKPTIICPFFVDQPYWGQRVWVLGAGSRPIRQKRLTAMKLADAIQEVTTNSTIRKNAEALGEKIRHEKGVERAIAIIENIGLQQTHI